MPKSFAARTRKVGQSLGLCLGLTIGLPMAALAQSGEIFIPGDSDVIPMLKPQPSNPLARCMYDASAANCAGIGRDASGVQFESAVAPEYETLVLDLDDNQVAISAAPPSKPPVYDAPAGASEHRSGKVALPAVAISIEFDYNSDHIRADQIGKLTQLVAALQDPALAGTPYAIIGHTDAVGGVTYNCDLSVRRAISVTRALDSSAVALPLYPVGFGEHVLKNPGNPKASENRRVTFLRLPNSPGAVLRTAASVCP